MSTWTDAKHERAQVLAAWLTSPGEDTKVSLADALAEIKRLRAENEALSEELSEAKKQASDAAWALDYDHQGGL